MKIFPAPPLNRAPHRRGSPDDQFLCFCQALIAAAHAFDLQLPTLVVRSAQSPLELLASP